MSKPKRLLFIFSYFGTSIVLLYHLVYSADWSLKYWPEGGYRKTYIDAHVHLLVNPFSTNDQNQQRIAALLQARPDIDQSIFNRLLLSFGGALILTSGLFLIPGFRRKNNDQYLRGAKLATADQLSKLTRKALRRPPITIGGVAIPTNNECLHFAVEGTTGTGKSLAIYTIIAQARRRSDRGLVMDVGGAYVSRFLTKGDTILSIGDSRSQHWDPFQEVSSEFDFYELGKNSIPDGKGEAAGWHEKGRVLFSNVFKSLYQTGEHRVSRLVHLIMTAEPEELAVVVAGTPAAIFCQAGNDKVLANTRAIISTYLQPWSMLPDDGGFSIKRWIREGRGWLFISYKDNQVGSIKNLLATWLGLAIAETLSLDELNAQRTWLIADEFDTLGRVDAALSGLTKLRKYKTSCVFGFQTVSQPRETYGRDNAETILSNLSNKLYLRAGHPEVAKYCADDLGQQQFKRTESSESKKEGLAIGDKSATAAERHAMEHIVMPAEIQKLPDRCGYLSLAGAYPIAPVKIPISDLPRVAPPFA